MFNLLGLSEIKNPQLVLPINTYSSGQYATRIIEILIYVIFIAAVVAFFFMLVWGGIEWITSSGEKERLARSQSRITNGLTGLIILLLLFVGIKTVNGVFGINFAGWGTFNNGSVVVATPTARPTVTRVPTQTPTRVPTSVLPSPTPTKISIPTAAPTSTVRPTVPPTSTPRPTSTSTPTSSPTAYPTSTISPTLTPIACTCSPLQILPVSWYDPFYPGDTKLLQSTDPILSGSCTGIKVNSVTFSTSNSSVISVCNPSSLSCASGTASYSDTTVPYVANASGIKAGSVTLYAIATLSNGYSCSGQISANVDPLPTSIPTLTPVPTNTPAISPVPGRDYLIIDWVDLMALPTSGPAWDSMKASADSTAVLAELCNQNNRGHPAATLASALIYARTGDWMYYNRALTYINAAKESLNPTNECSTVTNTVLALGRQLGAYVMAADLIRLNDSSFNTWLTNVRNDSIGAHSRWKILRYTSEDSANNWGTFALASIIAADRYLGDSAMVAQDWAIFRGYGIAFGWPFQKTQSFSSDWSCEPDGADANDLPIAINYPCVKSGYNIDGAPVEDASRTTFPAVGNYPAEAAQGYVVQALLLSRAGYDAWGVNNSQVKRVAEFRERFGNLNYSSADWYVNWMINHFYGMNQPEVAAGTVKFGRVFGFTDWLYGP